MFSIKYGIFLDTKLRNQNMKKCGRYWICICYNYYVQITYLATKPVLNIDFPPLVANTNILMF